MTSDTRNLDDVKQDLKYDHRNLLTEMRVVKKTGGGDGYETYQLMYNYDEAGNRVRKRVYFYQGEDPMPVFEEDDMTGSWDLVGDEYYVRDVSGKEIAVYNSYDLDHWNVWGTDNVGKINANGDKFFYIKDHLGSVRMVLNSSNQIVAANDYDCWGYPLENRSYQSDDIDYKFTGKQRDAETGYDYFGARYYDARIGRWGGVEPLLEKYISYSPYQYGLLNPINFVDIDGKDYWLNGPESNTEYVFEKMKRGTALNLYFDKETGKVNVFGHPDRKKLSEADRILYDAIKDPNKDYILYCTVNNINDGQEFPSILGYFKGGGIQEIYTDDIRALSKIEEDNVTIEDESETVMHEVIEGILGYNQNYLTAHKNTLRLLEQKEIQQISRPKYGESNIVDIGIRHNDQDYYLFQFDISKNKVVERYY